MDRCIRSFWVPLQKRAKTLFLTSGQKSARLPVIEWVPGHLQPPTRPGDGSQAPAPPVCAQRPDQRRRDGRRPRRPASLLPTRGGAGSCGRRCGGGRSGASSRGRGRGCSSCCCCCRHSLPGGALGGHLFELSPAPLGHPHIQRVPVNHRAATLLPPRHPRRRRLPRLPCRSPPPACSRCRCSSSLASAARGCARRSCCCGSRTGARCC